MLPMFRQWRILVGLAIAILVATLFISIILPAVAAPNANLSLSIKNVGKTQSVAIPAACAVATTLCPLDISLLNQQGQVALSGPLSQRPQPDTNFPFGSFTSAQQIFISGNDVNIVLAVLNPTNAPETITSVELRVVSFMPFAGTIPNAFAACDLRAYANGTAQPPTHVPGHDCNFNASPSITYGFPVSLSTTVTNGAIIPLNSDITNQGQRTSNAITVPPYTTSNGATTLLNVDIAPNRSGTYVFQVGVAVKGHPLTFFTTTLSALAITPDAVDTYWSAENCSIPGIRDQVPTSGAYLCPGPVATE